MLTKQIIILINNNNNAYSYYYDYVVIYWYALLQADRISKSRPYQPLSCRRKSATSFTSPEKVSRAANNLLSSMLGKRTFNLLRFSEIHKENVMHLDQVIPMK